jgi:hypothetical protein
MNKPQDICPRMLHTLLKCNLVTTSAQGYVQNAFTALAEESDNDNDDIQTVITQMAALTTQS